jgi:6-phosphogluconolactonase
LKIIQYYSNIWAESASNYFLDAIEDVLKNKKKCNVMLTGGKTAEKLYLELAKNLKLSELKNVHFYFSDERCVATNHPESNYGMVNRTLFVNKKTIGCFIYPMEADAKDQKKAASKYEKILPDQFDIMMFGIGEDGHIASLFPGSNALRDDDNSLVLPVISPKKPYNRLTITPHVISKAMSIFIIATGAKKAKVLCQMLSVKSLNDNFPLSYVMNATWLVDSELIDSCLSEHNICVLVDKN